ncbi:hypothetical protein WUBG_01400 [Wuchereria bancrofti]|nr:hypothetical protein WUBG_01400 [Wuchereria bancrofti]
MLEKPKTVKPKGFDLIESDIGEDIVQCLKQKVEAETMGMKRRDLLDIGRSEQCIPFGGLQVTFKMKTCRLHAKKECLAKREKQHLTGRKEVRRGIREITKVLKKPSVWGNCRQKRPLKKMV